MGWNQENQGFWGGQPEPPSLRAQPFSNPPPLPAVDFHPRRPAASSSHSLGAWRVERARRLRRICSCIEERVTRGSHLARAIRCFARRYRGKRYTSDPSRPMRFSFGTLLRVWYVWKCGKSPAAFELGYRTASKPTLREALEMVQLCLSPGVRWLRKGYSGLPRPAGRESTLRKAIPRPIQRDLMALLAHRRRSEAAERALTRGLVAKLSALSGSAERT